MYLRLLLWNLFHHDGGGHGFHCQDGQIPICIFSVPNVQYCIIVWSSYRWRNSTRNRSKLLPLGSDVWRLLLLARKHPHVCPQSQDDQGSVQEDITHLYNNFSSHKRGCQHLDTTPNTNIFVKSSNMPGQGLSIYYRTYFEKATEDNRLP